MSLFDGIPLDAYDTPQGPNICGKGPNIAAAAPNITPYIVTLKRASNGEEILLCNITPPPAGAVDEASRRKLPLFTYAEISAMRSAAADDPRYIDNLIHARRTFGWGGMITYRQEQTCPGA